jgi:hypothetical protein
MRWGPAVGTFGNVALDRCTFADNAATATTHGGQGVVSCGAEKPANVRLTDAAFEASNAGYDVFIGVEHAVYSDNATQRVIRAEDTFGGPASPQTLREVPAGAFLLGDDPSLATIQQVRRRGARTDTAPGCKDRALERIQML